MTTVLAIDPGREKCGLAVVGHAGILHKQVLPPKRIPEILPALIASHSVARIIVGAGTGGRALADALRELVDPTPIDLVDETLSTHKARARFFEDNPPRGLRRLIPRGLLVPHKPYDDYVAVILAEDYLERTEHA